MEPKDIATVVSVISALGVGSLIGQWFGRGKDRRTARAAVLDKLAEVEEVRWYRGPSDEDSFQKLIKQLETAALIARVPRAAVKQYHGLALGVLLISKFNNERTDLGSIPTEMSDAVHDAAEIIQKAAWSPMTSWLWLRWRIRRVNRKVEAIASQARRDPDPQSLAAHEAKLIKQAQELIEKPE
jgi:hypothetical protein